MVARYPEGTKRGGCVASIVRLIGTAVNTCIQTPLSHIFQKTTPQLPEISTNLITNKAII